MIRMSTTPLERIFDDPFMTAPASQPMSLPVDVHRTGSEVVVEASVPGFSPDEVDVSVDGDMLTISARHEHEQEHGGDHKGRSGGAECVRHERYFGSLYRQVYLGRGLDADKANASFNDGVLRVTIPLERKEQPKRIRVTGADRAR